MTCIKTGACVLFENYGYVVAADIYEIHGVYVIRWNTASRFFMDINDPKNRCTHAVTNIGSTDEWWHREDLGVTVVPKYLMREV